MAITSEPGPDGGIEVPDEDSAAGESTPDPQRGGCFNFGWGCLPVLAAVGLIVPGLLTL